MTTTDTTAQAGWYAVGGGQERYWDGTSWTEQVRPVPAYVSGEPRGDLLTALDSFSAPTETTSH